MEVQRTVKRRDQLASRLRRLKFAQVYPSSTNFLLVKVAAPDVLHEIFINQGIGVRNFSRTPGLSGCLRITLGTASENELILSCVKRYGDKLMQEGAN